MGQKVRQPYTFVKMACWFRGLIRLRRCNLLALVLTPGRQEDGNEDVLRRTSSRPHNTCDTMAEHILTHGRQLFYIANDKALRRLGLLTSDAWSAHPEIYI